MRKNLGNHSACSSHKILNSLCRNVDIEYGTNGCERQCDDITSGSASDDWQDEGWYRWGNLISIEAPKKADSRGMQANVCLNILWVNPHAEQMLLAGCQVSTITPLLCRNGKSNHQLFSPARFLRWPSHFRARRGERNSQLWLVQRGTMEHQCEDC